MTITRSGNASARRWHAFAREQYRAMLNLSLTYGLSAAGTAPPVLGIRWRRRKLPPRRRNRCFTDNIVLDGALMLVRRWL